MKFKILAASAALSLSGLASAGSITAGGPISSASAAIPLTGLMERLNRQALIVGNTLSGPIVIDNPPAATLAALRPAGVAPGAAFTLTDVTLQTGGQDLKVSLVVSADGTLTLLPLPVDAAEDAS